jgi:hypothetical protein
LQGRERPGGRFVPTSTDARSIDLIVCITTVDDNDNDNDDGDDDESARSQPANRDVDEEFPRPPGTYWTYSTY